MLITRIELENIKSYRHLTLDFRRGTTAISGVNGAGKTTLVEAIGYALFNHLPYNQSQFVREGEKTGKIVVHLLGSDDRPYEVERRCGASAQWSVFDVEANFRVEQRADVQDKLHDIFGIDRERPLESLFRDALGVPQGTFTAIFLEPARIRKETFNALLQIEDYETAFKYLLQVSNHYKEQVQEQKSEIQRLEIETRELPEWRATLKERRADDEQMKQQNVQYTEQLVVCEARSQLLKQQREQLNATRSAYAQQQTKAAAARQWLDSCAQSLRDARQAQQAIEASENDHARYTQADALLRQLRQDERLRNSLLEQSNQHRHGLATIEANIRNLLTQLDEVETARKRLAELAPFVEQQYELDMQRETLQRQALQHEGLVKDIKRLDGQQISSQQKLDGLQRAIAAIEPLQPLAAQFNERQERYTALQVQAAERSTKRRAFTEKNDLLQKKLDEKEQAATNLRKAEDFIAALEEHRAEAEELLDLQTQSLDLTAQVNRLKGNIDGYTKSRRLSAGGQCPLLHEPCQNIKARGLISLEFYFDDEIKRDKAEIDALNQRLSTVDKRATQVKRYADELSKIGFYTEKRDSYAERLRQVALEITHLEREISALQADLDALNDIDAQIAQARIDQEESQRADRQMRTLPGLQQQSTEIQEQFAQTIADIRERGQQAELLRDSAAQQKIVEHELKQLNDPRSQSKVQQATIQREEEYQQQLRREQAQQQQSEQRLQELQQQLAQYAILDARIAEQEAIRAMCQQGYHTYLKNQDIARQLPERELAEQQARITSEQTDQDLQAAESAYNEAKAAFNEEELLAIDKQITFLNREISAIARELSNLQEKINDLEHKIELGDALLIELEAARKEKATLEDLTRMVDQFRKLIKEAAPFVLKAMLTDISGEANRIFCEIMGDRSAQLNWLDDYEIVLRRQGIDRTFAQLSGGEQMSAALAMRLALLKKLSSLNIAFFDEPTQNMDELRRTNLADQIRRVRGFDQLFVISHDDTFEQSLDSLVRLRKKDGETHIVAEDETISEREQVTVNAS
ncbi:MAG TPA: SMC family ATPase [Ktedonobacteraceae bacterium]|nr:SMC family ATPase [Ktedonobacteraceae bacterium]